MNPFFGCKGIEIELDPIELSRIAKVLQGRLGSRDSVWTANLFQRLTNSLDLFDHALGQHGS